MKKLILTLAIITAAAIPAAEFKFPGWTCTDKTQFQTQLPLAPNDVFKVECAYMIALLENPPANYAAARQAIEAALDQYQPDAALSIRLTVLKKYPLMMGKWDTELIAFCQENPNWYDIHVAMRIPGAWSVQRLQECLLTDTPESTPATISKAITALVGYSLKGEMTREETKAALAALDIFYTVKLADDKDKWAPTVAKIRTLLERYN